MLQQNNPKKDRSVVNSATIQTPQSLVVTKDNPLYNLPITHPDYSKVVRQETSILDIDGGTVTNYPFENISSIAITPYNPSIGAYTNSTSNTVIVPLGVPTNVNILTQAGTYVSEKGVDGTIRETLTVVFDDVNGAVKYEVAVKEL